LFNGCKFTFKKTELEQREEFGNPDATTTADIKAGSYDKLTDGIIKNGTHINNGDAIIGKYVRITKGNTDDDFMFSDRSIIYKDDEPAIVHNVIVDRNEEDERFAKVGLRKIRPVAVGDKFCLTGDHEVLTTDGWKNIKDIKLTDQVATLNQETHHIEYQYPTDTPQFEHKGQMYSVQSQGVDLVTTLNHKMYARTSTSDYELHEAQNIQGRRMYYKKDCINNLEDIFDFELPEYTTANRNNIPNIHYPGKPLDMDSWLEFFGIYLAEGWVDNSKCVRIAAHKPRVMSKLLEVLENLEYDHKIYDGEPDYVYIRGRQLSAYLQQFGKSFHKFLPNWCYTLSNRQSSLLLNGLMLGDGYYDERRGSWEYYTGSERLANGVQILAIMSGQTASMAIKNPAGEMLTIKGVQTIRQSNQYRIYVSNYPLNKEPLIGGAKTTETLIDHDDMVYCITVPNSVFLARRNYTYIWTGNSSRAGLNLFWPKWNIKECFFNEMLWKFLLVVV
jgi:hypothetical protein